MKDLHTTVEVHNIYDIFMTMWDTIFNHSDYRNELPISPDCRSLANSSFCGHLVTHVTLTPRMLLKVNVLDLKNKINSTCVVITICRHILPPEHNPKLKIAQEKPNGRTVFSPIFTYKQ